MCDARQTTGRMKCPYCRGIFPCMLCEERTQASNSVCRRCIPKFMSTLPPRRAPPQPALPLLERINELVQQHALLCAVWIGISPMFSDWVLFMCGAPREEEECAPNAHAQLALRLGAFVNLRLNVCVCCERIIECVIRHAAHDPRFVDRIQKLQTTVQIAIAPLLITEAVRIGCAAAALSRGD
jgi:hypothetical protein